MASARRGPSGRYRPLRDDNQVRPPGWHRVVETVSSSLRPINRSGMTATCVHSITLRMSGRLPPPNLLRDARVYLSGPMDFVASRAAEQKLGWRNRVGDF